MYFQRDYVLRMIEMIGELARRLLAKGDALMARQEINEIAQKACGLPVTMLETGDPAMLRDLLEEPQRFLAAELISIATKINERSQTDDELLPLRMQALALYGSLRDPDYLIAACERAKQILSDYLDQLPVESLETAAGLLEAGGEYAAAEDAFYAMYEKDPAQRPLAQSYYERLSRLDDRALLAGGLTRAEISEGIASLN